MSVVSRTTTSARLSVVMVKHRFKSRCLYIFFTRSFFLFLVCLCDLPAHVLAVHVLQEEQAAEETKRKDRAARFNLPVAPAPGEVKTGHKGTCDLWSRQACYGMPCMSVNRVGSLWCLAVLSPLRAETCYLESAAAVRRMLSTY